MLVLVFTTVSAQPPSLEPSKVDSLKNAISTSEGVKKASALFELAKVYSRLNIDSTKLFIDEALGICRRRNDDTTYILIAAGMQFFLGSVGEKDLARKYLISARNLKSREAMNPKYQNLPFVGLYFIHYWNYTRYDSSVYYGLKTVDLMDDFTVGKADGYIIVGAAYNKMGDNIKALEYYNAAQTILMALPFNPAEYCYLYNQLGMLYSDESDLKKSEEFYHQSIALGKKVGGFPHVSPLTNLAVVYDRMGEYDKSLKYFDSAAVLLHTATDPWRTAINVRNKGKALTHAGKPKEGIVETLKAMEMYARLKDNYTLARLHLQLSESYRLLGDFKTAEREALLALEWDRTYGYGELVKESYRELARTYAATRQFGKAFEYQNRYLEILDSLNSAERRNKFVQLEKNFEFATQEKMRQQLARENELYLAQARADRKIRTYLILGTIVLMGAMIIAVVAYRRIRSQNVVLNQQNKKIEDQTEQLQEAAKTKSRFFANVSHEFRTPLTLILGPVENLINESKRPAERQQLTLVKNNTTRLTRLVNQLLELSKLEAGNITLEYVYEDIVQFLKLIAFAFQSLADQKKISVTFKNEPASVLTKFDRDKLEKIFSNLLSNAFKFAPEQGQVAVDVRVQDQQIRVEVTDSGPGIAADDLPYIFNRFYRSGTSSRSTTGSGIGLELTKELVGICGGNISVANVPSGGAQFVVTLPLITDTTAISVSQKKSKLHPPVMQESAPILLSADRDLTSTREERDLVLVIEDNPEVRAFIEESIKPQYRVLTAENGEEGIEKALGVIPDLVITDVMMPVKGGLEVCRTLKEAQETSHVPIIMLTAKADVESRIEGLETGADDYLEKPFHTKELLARIQNLIRLRQKLQEKFSSEPRESASSQPEDELPLREKQFLNRLREMIDLHLAEEEYSVVELSRDMAMSRMQLHRKLKALTDTPTSLYIRSIRLDRGRQMLEEGLYNVSEVAYRVGFNSPTYFSTCFSERFGFPPSEVKQS